MDKAIFAAGCFWGVEATFKKIEGVVETTVGYTGGDTANPSYQELLEVFWANHNPTTLNKQGVDVGSQYRSAIFYTTKQQQKLAQQSKQELDSSDQYSDPIVTDIEEAGEFYKAEEYHQDYFAKQGSGGCKF